MLALAGWQVGSQELSLLEPGESVQGVEAPGLVPKEAQPLAALKHFGLARVGGRMELFLLPSQLPSLLCGFALRLEVARDPDTFYSSVGRVPSCCRCLAAGSVRKWEAAVAMQMRGALPPQQGASPELVIPVTCPARVDAAQTASEDPESRVRVQQGG